MSALEIMLERDTANDESAVIVAIFVASGSEVAEDELIAEFENSKSTQELRAPQSGVLVHALAVGQEVAFGVPIAKIVAAGANVEPAQTAALPPVAVPVPVVAMPAAPAAAKPAVPARFSHEALALLKQFGLAESQFEAGFVTSAAVRARLPGATPPAPVSKAPRPALSIPAAVPAAAGVAVDRRKQREIETLQNGAGATMLSVLGKTLGKVNVPRAPGDVFAGRIADLVIYEAARLMRKFPKLNAQYAEGMCIAHDAVHAGIAIDGGGKLVVYGIEDADRQSLPELSRIVGDAVGRYMDDRLTGAELTRATFTVTDLSADDLDFVLPLLPRGQSCIIGITHDAASGFRLFAGFDHRVTEGREVAAFLTALGERVSSFSVAAAPAATTLRCGFCAKTMSEAVGRGKDKGFLPVVDRKGETVLCCASCWNGW
jgi:2-oxoglutarate dehydrogenase E2 component (dihydrolipoamide succinyltransferase)